MRLPRDLSGEDLAALLRRRYGYRFVRQSGSHMTLAGAVGPVSQTPRMVQLPLASSATLRCRPADGSALSASSSRTALG